MKWLLILEFDQSQTYAGSTKLSDRGEALEKLTVSGLGSLAETRTDIYNKYSGPKTQSPEEICGPVVQLCRAVIATKLWCEPEMSQ
ncbi:hypothetical protein DPEC_G00111460 [Dallia pectoralis]|uniref:Uncharacterized protein n=1 Tax=Dallia pectoralis TaxID=75939 RepID=A0ACC2GTQ0_DALPE|nr:hypothetical protein DPEC_G00111460 [Dallia pectoralis]